MCGILGFASLDPARQRERLASALHTLDHRGPDDRGFGFHETSTGWLAFGHTRLSIIDLGPGGHQPMDSACGRWSMIYNGELYNYRELRSELECDGEIFTTASDTEVLLRMWMRFGPAALPRFVGMFAFAVYDREKQTLALVRDAFGIKPLYYWHDRERFAFASEAKALIALDVFRPCLNLERAYRYLVFGAYDEGEDTFIEGICRLPPAHWIEFDLRHRTCNGPRRWWRPAIAERPIAFGDAVEQLRERFLASVRLHLRSDVPIGAALSGGIDSSSVVCAMRHLEPGVPIHTFTFVASNSPVDEERWADLVAGHTGAVAHKVVIRPAQLAEDLDDLIRTQDEPFGSTSIYAQYRLFRLVRDCGVKVTLDGQGADELLAGYGGYPGPRFNSLVERRQFRQLARLLWRWGDSPGRSRFQGLAALLGQRVPRRLRRPALALVGRSVAPPWLDERYLKDRGVRAADEALPRDADGWGRRLSETLRTALIGAGLEALLRHGDRNSMRWSIESRVPFLTVGMAEFLLSLPEEYLLSANGETKHVFRAAMRDIVPDAILDRRDKIGFATPEQSWMQDLAPVVRRWVSDFPPLPFVKRDRLQFRFSEALDGRRPIDGVLWRFINFNRWLQLHHVSLGAN
jgi:asparagine synthase (glutamine-hydrolysing)